MYTQKYQNVRPRTPAIVNNGWLLPFVFLSSTLLGIAVGAYSFSPKNSYQIDVNQDGVKDVLVTKGNGESITIFQSEGDHLIKLESPSDDLLKRVKEEIKKLEGGQ